MAVTRVDEANIANVPILVRPLYIKINEIIDNPVQGGGGSGDGSETKVTQGSNVTVTGSGTIASPYVINSSGTTDITGKVDKETYTSTAIAGSTYTLVAASRQNPLFQSTATGAFTIALSGVTTGQHGEWVITVNTASSVVVTLPTGFTNRQFGVAMASTYTLPAGTSGRVVILYYSTVDGTTLDWVFADSNIQTQLNNKVDTTDIRLSDARYTKSIANSSAEIILSPGTTAQTTILSIPISAGSLVAGQLYTAHAIVRSSQASSKTFAWRLTDGTTSILIVSTALTANNSILIGDFALVAALTTVYTNPRGANNGTAGVLLSQATNAWSLQLTVTMTTGTDNAIITAYSFR